MRKVAGQKWDDSFVQVVHLLFNIGMTLAMFNLSGTIPRGIDKFIKKSMALGMNLNIVLGLMIVAEFVIADMIVLTSSIFISGICIPFSILSK